MCTVTQQLEHQTFCMPWGYESYRAKRPLKVKGCGHDLTSLLSIQLWICYSNRNDTIFVSNFEIGPLPLAVVSLTSTISDADFSRYRRKPRTPDLKPIKARGKTPVDLFTLRTSSLFMHLQPFQNMDYGLTLSDCFKQVGFTFVLSL